MATGDLKVEMVKMWLCFCSLRFKLIFAFCSGFFAFVAFELEKWQKFN